MFYNMNKHITLIEYSSQSNGKRPAFQENCFEPVLPTEMFEELMNEINQPIEAL